MKRSSLVALCFLFFACNRSGVTTEDEKLDSICIPMIDTFFGKVELKNYKGALNDLLLSNDNINPGDSATLTMKDRFYSINSVSGAFMGSSLLKKRFVKNSLAIYSYLAKYDKKFYRFVFVFYNNGVKTKIYKFSFDDSLDIELDESIKLYM